MDGKYTIIIPVFFNEGSLKKTMEKLIDNVISKNGNLEPEVIFIDDGSQDNSLAELFEIKDNYSFVKIIKFTRNFGQVSAILAGFKNATGDCIINISADLQDPPELITDMLHHFFIGGSPLVICERLDRDESYYRKVTSKFFYKIMQRFTFKNMPVGGFDFFLISAQIKDIIISKNESNAFLQGQILSTGYKPKFIPYHRAKREVGKSRWTFGKKIKYLIDGILGYSYLPLRLMTIIGIIVSLSGFFYAIIIVIERIFGNTPFSGWAPIMILILVLSGIQMLMLGIIGEYLWRALDQIRNREPYIIEKIFE